MAPRERLDPKENWVHLVQWDFLAAPAKMGAQEEQERPELLLHLLTRHRLLEPQWSSDLPDLLAHLDPKEARATWD